MGAIVIDWNEVILLVIGAVIGIISSMAMIFIQAIIEKARKLSIYTKCVGLKKNDGWGVYDMDSVYMLGIQAIFEIENTSKRARIMRDMSLVLMNNNKVVAKMEQKEHLPITEIKDSKYTHEKIYYGDDKGSYSFMIEPTSIKREKCVYLYYVGKDDVEKYAFNKIGLQYYDEKNKLIVLTVRDYDGWEIESNKADLDWIYINPKSK